MMIYNYRWFYLILFSLVAVFFLYQFDIKFLLNHKSALMQQKKILETERKIKLAKVNQHHTQSQLLITTTKEEMLKDVSVAAHLNNLILKQDTNLSEEKITNRVMYAMSLTLTGTFSNINAFLNALQQLPSPIFFTDISYHLLPTQLLDVKLTLVRFQTSAAVINPDAVLLNLNNNPFCHAVNMISNESILLHDVPLAAIKIIGFTEHGMQKQVWLMTPGGHLAFVKYNTQFGKEEALVIAIEKHRMRVKLSSGQLRDFSF